MVRKKMGRITKRLRVKKVRNSGPRLNNCAGNPCKRNSVPPKFRILCLIIQPKRQDARRPDSANNMLNVPEWIVVQDMEPAIALKKGVREYHPKFDMLLQK